MNPPGQFRGGPPVLDSPHLAQGRKRPQPPADSLLAFFQPHTVVSPHQHGNVRVFWGDLLPATNWNPLRNAQTAPPAAPGDRALPAARGAGQAYPLTELHHGGVHGARPDAHHHRLHRPPKSPFQAPVPFLRGGQPLGDAPPVGLHRRRRVIERDRRHRRRDIFPHTRQPPKPLRLLGQTSAVHPAHLPRRRKKIPRPGIIAQPLPFPQNILFAGVRQGINRGITLHPPPVAGRRRRRRRLLQHHLGHPNPVGIRRPPPPGRPRIPRPVHLIPPDNPLDTPRRKPLPRRFRPLESHHSVSPSPTDSDPSNPITPLRHTAAPSRIKRALQPGISPGQDFRLNREPMPPASFDL